MEITGIFINGFEILGFQVRTKKGERASSITF